MHSSFDLSFDISTFSTLETPAHGTNSHDIESRTHNGHQLWLIAARITVCTHLWRAIYYYNATESIPYIRQ